MSNDIAAGLKGLSLHGMASAWPELLGIARLKSLDHEALLHQLIKAEGAHREVRSMAYQMRAARFPHHRDLAGFAFDQAQVDEALVRQLHELRFIDSAHNVVFVGGPGTGKTHLATSLGVHAIRVHGKRVRFFSTVELVNMLEAEKAQGKAGQLAHRLMYVDLVILDEMGYLPFSQAGGALLFHLLSKLYERTSVVVTTKRRQDDHGAAGPTHPSLPHRRDRQSELALQALDGTTGRNQVHPQQNTQRSRPDSRLIHNRAVRFFVNLVAQFWT
jgi:DNA replication protein DnaC